MKFKRNLKIFLYLVFLISSNGITAIIRVPTDEIKIQAAINVAQLGDTVLVLPGRYLENIYIMNKNIVLGSLNLISDNPQYITETIIDGGKKGRAIRIKNVDSTAIVQGFTITNGSYTSGAGISCGYSDVRLINLIITRNKATWRFGRGGGIDMFDSSPLLKNVSIIGNESTVNGGGVAINRGSPHFENVTIAYNRSEIHGGGIYMFPGSPTFDETNRSNIHSNLSGNGSDIYGKHSPDISVFVDTFSVLEPTDYHIYPRDEFSFNIINGKLEQVHNDIYVGPLGNDANSGLAPSEPLCTISCALSRIVTQEENPRCIYLSSGEYRRSITNEHFPLNLINNVKLIGQSIDSVILDAERKSNVIQLFYDNNVSLYNFSVTGGVALWGGAISCSNSDLFMHKIKIFENRAEDGGALSFFGSKANLNFVSIVNNFGEQGGGINTRSSEINLKNVTIVNNRAHVGGVLYCFNNARTHFENSIAWNNLPREIYFRDVYNPNKITLGYTILDGGINTIITNDNGSIDWQCGNLNTDPLFVDADNNDVTLLWKSPAIDKGDPNSEIDPDGTRADMGAYPFDQSKFIGSNNFFLCYPNPFSTSTRINYEIKEEVHVKVVIYNVLGQRIKTLLDSIQQPGYRFTTWDGSDHHNNKVKSGTYIISFILKCQSITRKVTVLNY